ncbi:E3 Ubiquitin ligase [Mactra antiquata]
MKTDELPMPNLPEIRRERRESDIDRRHLIREIDQLRRANIELAKKNVALTTENEDLEKNRFKCNTCFSQKLCVLLPCGHVYICETCSNKVNGKCPYCRSNIEAIKNVFIV